MDEIKQEIIYTLSKTKRPGMEDLIDHMEKEGFFTSPCSGGNHLAKEGGLAEHSLNVLHIAEKMGVALYGKTAYNKIRESVEVVTLLHDLGKMGQFGKPNYTPNVLKSGKVSTTKPYETNKDLLHVDHEIRSVVIASMFIDLTEEEHHAILYHNGLYGNLKYAISGKETPLYMLVHFADMWASRVVEVTK